MRSQALDTPFIIHAGGHVSGRATRFLWVYIYIGPIDDYQSYIGYTQYSGKNEKHRLQFFRLNDVFPACSQRWPVYNRNGGELRKRSIQSDAHSLFDMISRLIVGATLSRFN